MCGAKPQAAGEKQKSVSRIYLILSVAGWAWMVVFMGYLTWRLWPRRERRGFEVVGKAKDDEHERRS